MRWADIGVIVAAILLADLILWLFRWALHSYASYRSSKILGGRKMYSNTVWGGK
jgi:hypothetical protein